MGDNIADPANTFGNQTETKNIYEMQLPAWLKTDPKIQEPFQTPSYKSALENYYNQDFSTIQDNIRKWFETTTPRIKTKVGSTTSKKGSPFGTVMGGMIPTKQYNMATFS